MNKANLYDSLEFTKAGSVNENNSKKKMNTILIVDDDSLFRTRLSNILSSEYKLHTANDGEACLEMAEKIMPDLILLDYVMPGKDGFEVIERLKLSTRTNKIPVIFITGTQHQDLESKGLALGAIDFITKPFNPVVVKLRVRQQIRIINLSKELEQTAKVEKMSNEVKTKFLANMSHEIRTPMNSILGITEILLENRNISHEVVDGLTRIYTSCELLMEVIDDILDVSKIEEGKLEIVPAEYKFAELINDSVLLNTTKINEKPVKFEVKADASVPQVLIGDVLRIKQILNNLLSNAFKYTETGTVTLHAGIEPTHALTDDKVVLVLGVRDTGRGMTPEQKDMVFNEYARFDDEITGKKIAGTGLGLSITKQIVDMMEGSIHVESTVGSGTLIVVRLPQNTIKDAPPIGPVVAENLQFCRSDISKKRLKFAIKREPMPDGKVLIVDDVETNLYVAQGLMKFYRLQIDAVMSGKKAVEKIKSGHKYDIIFMDHMMPEMDGIQATYLIRSLGYNNTIIALTANALSGQEEMFLKNGFDGFIAKPIDVYKLDTLLTKYVRQKKPSFSTTELPNLAELSNHDFESQTRAGGEASPPITKINPVKKSTIMEVGDKRESAYVQSPMTSPAPQSRIDPILIELFVRDANRAIATLERLLKYDDINSNEKSLKNYIVAVHGIKNPLHSIGEISLHEKAKKLEMAGRSNDFETIYNDTPELLEKLKLLLLSNII